MRRIPLLIWAAVIFGWIGASDTHMGAIAWLLGIGILAFSYYAEKPKD